MKATLLALLTLGSLAMAADITDEAFQKVFLTTTSEESYDLTDPTTQNKDFSYTFELNQAGLTLIGGYVGSPIANMKMSLVSVIGTNTGEKFGVAMGYSSDQVTINKGGAFMCNTDAGKDVQAPNSYYGVNNWLGVNSDAMDCLMYLQGVSLTFTANMSSSQGSKLYTTLKYGLPGSEVQYYDTIPSEDTPFMEASGLRWADFAMDTLKVNPDYVSKVVLYDRTLSQQEALASNQAIFSMVAPIPEPTTGTLSLLALAGLCIRRRK